ncbi:IclR family transcriptional regulator [Cupriavidus nantongensis]|uniref:IclR family transcriptional regulator n=1 Tax=Cupriavidus nantongensis TaxID=1796606 RepID=A0A142JR32_9BURK|nr:IclR family transcriptional regulator [Cupriavidus nantongensis]AMR80544.1 IclR family transcriptional regulator [Cupriavidus nantongensis]
MPKKPVQSPLAEEDSAPGGASTVDRALSLLDAFTMDDRTLTLSELAERTRMYKSTTKRMLASLQHRGLVIQNEDGTFGLGGAIARLNAIYVASFSLESVVMPVLEDLVKATQETAAYYVRQGAMRLCLFRVDSPQPMRVHVKTGDLLPLDQGSGGRVLLAFSGAKGKIYDAVREAGVAALVGDRKPDIAGVSAPVFDAENKLAGAVTLTLPASRFSDSLASAVVNSAAKVTGKLRGN